MKDQNSPSGLRLALCVALPIALGWLWPRNHGASAEAFAVLLGLLLAGIAGTAGLGAVRRGALVWLAGGCAAILLRGSPIPLYNLMLLPLGLAAWIGFALGGQAFRDERVARAVGLGLAIGVALNLAAALLQYLHLDGHFRPWVTEAGLSDRVYGNTRQPNHLGMLMVFGMALLWWVAVRRALSLRSLALLMALASLGVALSGSRIAVLAAFALALMALVWRSSVARRPLGVFLAAPVLVLMFSWGMGVLSQSLGLQAVSVVERDNTTVSMRTFHWNATLEMIEAEPWLGAGWREYRHARFLIRPEDASVEVVEHAHNLVLHLAAELGIPLMLAITVPVLVFIVRRRPWQERDSGAQAAWMVLLLVLLYSMVEFPLWVMNFLFLACVAAGVVLEAGRGPGGAAAGKGCVDEGGGLALPKGLAWLLVVATLLALVDYDRASASSGKATAFHWGASEGERQSQAHSSVLFGVYADTALVRSGKVRVSEQTYRSLLELTDRLMHFGPDEHVLSGRFMAYCQGQDLDNLDETIRAYRLAFPDSFKEFIANLPPETARRCRVSSTMPSLAASLSAGR